jgi:hypothetical protein
VGMEWVFGGRKILSKDCCKGYVTVVIKVILVIMVSMILYYLGYYCDYGYDCNKLLWFSWLQFQLGPNAQCRAPTFVFTMVPN